MSSYKREKFGQRDSQTRKRLRDGDDLERQARGGPELRAEARSPTLGIPYHGFSNNIKTTSSNDRGVGLIFFLVRSGTEVKK
jgi:hypothetical protein